ncbi:hypothetical protein QQF64_034253 [Cirrhinus molitorella]|uniref:Uncharacterized protein n=1 Tax=Cirrhinus molitorella TaxID=172907 RepID=A0ABR3MWB0_9TELE
MTRNPILRQNNQKSRETISSRFGPSSTHGGAPAGSKGPRHMPKRKKPQKNRSYHTRLEAFPIRSVVRERVRKNKEEILVEWEPCPVCGKEWAHSWQPKDSLQINEKK